MAIRITPETFKILLDWLSLDENEAGGKYEGIRLGLIKMFVARGSSDPEHLADLTIDRVATKVESIRTTYSGNPAHYFRGVGNNIFLESLKNRREEPMEIDPAIEAPSNFGVEYECLNSCLAVLPDNQCDLILDYYIDSRSAKIERRRTMAAELGIEANTLRIRAHRIRSILADCVKKCIGDIK